MTQRSTGLSEEAGLIASIVGDDAANPRDLQAIIDDLRADRDRARRLLDELARSPDVDVRAWVPGAAREVLGEAAVPVILSLTRDGNADVQDVAIEELFELGPESARVVIPDLRRKLRSKEIYQPVFAMWKLAELGDRDSLPLVRAVADEADSEYPFHQKTARVICMLMENPREIVERIRAHDHELMQWLTMAAPKLRTKEARAALEECARTAPDRECRQMCADALAAWEGAA